MEGEKVKRWIADVWLEVTELCDSVTPAVVLAELAARGWERIRRTTKFRDEPGAPDPVVELRTLVTEDLPMKSAASLNAFRQAIGDVRAKLVSNNSPARDRYSDEAKSFVPGEQSQPEVKAEQIGVRAVPSLVGLFRDTDNY